MFALLALSSLGYALVLEATVLLMMFPLVPVSPRLPGIVTGIVDRPFLLLPLLPHLALVVAAQLVASRFPVAVSVHLALEYHPAALALVVRSPVLALRTSLDLQLDLYTLALGKVHHVRGRHSPPSRCVLVALLLLYYRTHEIFLAAGARLVLQTVLVALVHTPDPYSVLDNHALYSRSSLVHPRSPVPSELDLFLHSVFRALLPRDILGSLPLRIFYLVSFRPGTPRPSYTDLLENIRVLYADYD